jgi:nitrate/TMAO reductase-like tetraheme cytochrome c subunit
MPSVPADQQARDAAAGRVAGPRARTKAAWETGRGEMAQIDWQTSVRNSSGTCHSI